MKRSAKIFLAAVLAASLSWLGPVPRAEGPALTGPEILKKIDANQVADSIVMTFRMTVNRGGNRRPKVLEMKSWVAGRDRAAMEVISGPDKGVRCLKLGDDLWIASREAERPMKISGHMLRQSMLDSDWSYEDSTDNRPLSERFDAELQGVEQADGRDLWVLELTARGLGEGYPRQTLWVDQLTFLPVKQELKALSGMLLKTLTYEDLNEVQGRWTPMKMTMRDALKKDASTVVEVLEIKFGETIDPRIVSLEFVENVH
jgi:outer membrane lipoprotein-sorting protein